MMYDPTPAKPRCIMALLALVVVAPVLKASRSGTFSAQPFLRSLTLTQQLPEGIPVVTFAITKQFAAPHDISAIIDAGGRGFSIMFHDSPEAQRNFGNALTKALSSGLRREDFWVGVFVTCGMDPMPILDRAGLEYADVLSNHGPCKQGEEATMAQWRELEDQVMAGKAKALGVSDYNGALKMQQLDRLLESARLRPVVHQTLLNLRAFDSAELAFFRERNILPWAWSPLGETANADVLSSPALSKIASDHGKSSAQIALRWVAQLGALLCTSTSNPEHVRADLAITKFELSEDEMKALAPVE